MNKGKFTIEYDMKRAPVMLLWNHIATPSGLSQWFADDVEQNGKSLKFRWGSGEGRASIIATRYGSYMKYKWDDEDDEEKLYFEMKIIVSELTANTTLEITDFASSKEDEASSIELWNYQVDILKRLLGCL